MHDVANSRADAHMDAEQDFQEDPVEGVTGTISGETVPFTEEEQIGETATGASLDIIDFGNRRDYYLRTWDSRAWEYPR